MLIYGKQTFHYLCQHHSELIEEIYLSKELDKKEFSAIARLNKPILRVDNKKAQSMAKGGNHQGMFAKIQELPFKEFAALKKADFLLLLCGLTDVGNLGAIIRTAYSLGVGGVILGGLKQINLEGVIRTSSGAALDMPMCLQFNILDTVNELKQSGFSCYGADMKGEDIRKGGFESKKVLVLGHEHEGIPNKVLTKMDKIVRIEMEHGFDSLNVNAAAAIMMDRMRDG